MVPSIVRRRLALPLAFGSLILAGCSTFSPDGGLDQVAALTNARTAQTLRFARPQAEAAQAPASGAVRALLAEPLNPESAVQVALLNNKGLQAALAELGVAEADLVQAGRLRNPGFSFGRLHGNGENEIDRSVIFDLAGLLTMPIRQAIEQQRFSQAQLGTAMQAVQLASDVRRAYYTAVAARQTALYMEQVAEATGAGGELAARLHKAGNWSRLDAAREQAFHLDATARLGRARLASHAAREQLTRLLGLAGEEANYSLPDRLPDLPDHAHEISQAEQRAMDRRLDVQMARMETEATARALGLTRTTRFVNVLEAGYANKSQAGSPRQNGYEVSLELPLFDWGGARTARAEALYTQSLMRTADVAIRARSEVREAYAAYHGNWEIARQYRDEVVPLRKKISDEVLLRYNGMLASVFELLADAREQIAAVNGALEAQRDFWLAETDMHAALSGAGGATARRVTNISISAAPAAAAHD